MSTLGDLAQMAEAIAENDRIHLWDTSADEGCRDKYISPQQMRDIVLGAANTFTADQSISGTLDVSGNATVGGRLGIGTTSPQELLHVAGLTPVIKVDTPTGSRPARFAGFIDGNAYYSVNLDYDGTWLLDNTSYAGAILSLISGTASTHPALQLRYASAGANPRTLTELLRVQASGNVGIGTTSPSYKLDVSGDINASGSVRSNGTPLTSDGTLKDAPTPTKSALSKLAAVRGYEFTWSDKARQMGLPEGTQHGLIAQEVEQIFPDLVSEWEVETGEYVEGENGEQTPMKKRIKCVDYARMVPILLEAVRELAGRVDALNDTDPTTKK